MVVRRAHDARNRGFVTEPEAHGRLIVDVPPGDPT